MLRRGVIASGRRRTVATPALVANLLGNNGLSATTATVAFSLTGSGAVAGNTALIMLGCANSETVNVTAAPSGATQQYETRITGQLASAWLYTHTITSGDITAGTLTFTLGSALRSIGHAAVYSGVTLTGALFSQVTEATADTTAPIPSRASVPAGALFHGHVFRKVASGAVPDVAAYTGYSQGTSERSATAFGSGTQCSCEAAYKVVGAAGTYGGDNAAVASSFGVSYAAALPAA